PVPQLHLQLPHILRGVSEFPHCVNRRVATVEGFEWGAVLLHALLLAIVEGFEKRFACAGADWFAARGGVGVCHCYFSSANRCILLSVAFSRSPPSPSLGPHCSRTWSMMSECSLATFQKLSPCSSIRAPRRLIVGRSIISCPPNHLFPP